MTYYSHGWYSYGWSNSHDYCSWNGWHGGDSHKTLLHEDFNRIHDPDDSNKIVSDDGWDVKCGKLYTDGKNDGSVLFTEVDACQPVKIEMDIQSINACRFENWQDSLTIEAKIDGEWVLLDEFRVNEHNNTFYGSKTGQAFNDHGGKLTYEGGVLDDVDDSVQLRITSDFSWKDEKVLIDNVKITTEDGKCTDCEGTKVDFNDLYRGEVVSDQIEGVTISAQRAGDSESSENDAMIFDSARPTGRDYDLRYADQGKILIISEDNDSGDPDDNAHGGTFTFDFDTPSKVESITALDNEEGGRIELFNADGDLIKTVNLTATPNNGQAVVDIDGENVAQMVITLNGSGALDDLCFEPMPNTDPDAMDDSAAVCADEAVMIDVLANDDDVDGDDLMVSAINGEAVEVGDTVVLDNGAEVTVNADGTVTYDSDNAVYDGLAADDILIGDHVEDSFTYSVSDGMGGTADANVDVKICGAKNTVDTIADRVVPDEGTMVVEETSKFDYKVTLSDTGNADIDGMYEDAYCVDFDAPLPSIQTGDPISVDINVAGAEPTDYEAVGPNLASPGIEEDLDNIGWILNEDFGAQDNGDGAGETYTQAEIQAAIWGITNLTVKDTLDADGIPDKLAEAISKTTDGSTVENAMEIYNAAVTEGEGYEATEDDDIIALLLTPTNGDDVQPFVVGIEFEELEEDCDCDLLV